MPAFAGVTAQGHLRPTLVSPVLLPGSSIGVSRAGCATDRCSIPRDAVSQ